MDQSIALFPEDELIGLDVELRSSGTLVDWTLLERSVVRRAPRILTIGDCFLLFLPDAGLSTLGAKVVLILLRCYSL